MRICSAVAASLAPKLCWGAEFQCTVPATSCVTTLSTTCMQEGYGVNTFVFINDQGAEKLVKFHWRPTIGELEDQQCLLQQRRLLLVLLCLR